MLKKNVSLKPFNTFGINVQAQFFAEIRSQEQLVEILNLSELSNYPKLVLGEGSNILFTENFPGLILKMEIPGIRKISEDEEHVCLEVGAGENWHQLVMYCLEQGYAGLENLSLIPGTVGAAPLQNIGAYGVEFKQVFLNLTALHIQNQTLEYFDNKACQFGYRESIFKTQLRNQYIITSVALRLHKIPRLNIDYAPLQKLLENTSKEHLTIKDISNAVIKIRREKLPDPKIIGNAGSFFKNPVITADQFQDFIQHFPNAPYYNTADKNHYKIPAAWLIETCGWKGHRNGNAGVHQQHALVLVNYGEESGKNIHHLAQAIKASVKEKFDLELLTEVNIY